MSAREPLSQAINSRIRLGILTSVLIQIVFSSIAIVIWQSDNLESQFEQVGRVSASQISAAINIGNELLIVGELKRITLSGPIFASRIQGPDINYTVIRKGYKNDVNTLLTNASDSTKKFSIGRFINRQFVLKTAQSIKGDYVFTTIADRLSYMPPLLFILASLFLLAGLNYFILSVYVGATAKKISSPFSNLSTYLKRDGLREEFSLDSEESGIYEYSVLVSSLKIAQKEMVDYQHKVSELAVGEKLFSLSRQVAHDIRSPLAALDMALKDVGTLPEDTRILIRSATQRIRDIANNLLKRKQFESNTQMSTGKTSEMASNQLQIPNSIQLISSLIESIVSEKRLQFRSKNNIDIYFELTEKSYGLFAIVDAPKFKSVVSNLINNSVEALGEKGRVNISVVSGDSSFIQIQVQDTGRGIPTEVLKNLGKLGASFGKEGTESGSGVGLYDAHAALREWGGNLLIESEVGLGTTVTLNLPRAGPPPWFVDKVSVQTKAKVVVLDDDVSIHKVWNGRFTSAAPDVTLIHFSSPNEFEKWTAINKADLYLIDLELIGFGASGLDLIERLQLSENSILVTSRYEELQVQNRCLRLNVGLIPKSLAILVPIKTIS